MYLHENKELFEQIILKIGETKHIEYGIIEKDYYVTMILKGLSKEFSDLIFKGGTSLSKCYKLINRFSEDIDLNINCDVSPTDAQRKKLKTTILEVANKLGLSLINEDEIRSRRDYNKYKLDFDALFTIQGLKPYVYIETVYSVKSYPVEKKFASSYIYDYLCEYGFEDIIKEYDLLPFEVSVQSLERTFVDKIYAICDYVLDGRIKEHSRHIYDLYKIYPKIKIDDKLKALFKETKEIRKNNPFCFSAQDNIDIKGLLKRIVDEEIFKKDYNEITLNLLFEKLQYDEVIGVIDKIIKSELFF